eukprot:TRINITY_DN6005_c0_g1_i1.p1 TRINITY_DN6005_c0_g1~~TRINITY_DN6005_c0_g1_i1.p1  ORF type:complete len:406 (-),score=159.65 TRINITY_DN6005_c0_g1_i1:36-1160(-)
MAATVLFQDDPFGIPIGVSPYLIERKVKQTEQEWEQLLADLRSSTTLYVGNLSFFTTEEQIYELFSRCGMVKRVIMGLNRVNKTPCGFCFVEYYNHTDAENAQKYLSGTKLDDRVIRADVDPGFTEGRQYGRSRASGGQVRDDHRQDFDAGRPVQASPVRQEMGSGSYGYYRGGRGRGGYRGGRGGGGGYYRGGYGHRDYSSTEQQEKEKESAMDTKEQQKMDTKESVSSSSSSSSAPSERRKFVVVKRKDREVPSVLDVSSSSSSASASSSSSSSLSSESSSSLSSVTSASLSSTPSSSSSSFLSSSSALSATAPSIATTTTPTTTASTESTSTSTLISPPSTSVSSSPATSASSASSSSSEMAQDFIPMSSS